MAETFRLKIITPEKVFYEDEADMVEFNTQSGLIGVYAGHIPLTAPLAPGILTIHRGGEKKQAALHTGFAVILQTQVTILAEACQWTEEIDVK